MTTLQFVRTKRGKIHQRFIVNGIARSAEQDNLDDARLTVISDAEAAAAMNRCKRCFGRDAS